MLSRPRTLIVALSVLAGALAGQMVRDGSAGWAAVRVIAVAAVTSVLLYGMLRAGPVRRAVCALIAGCAGTVAGAGIGAGHVAKSVLTLTTCLGLVVLAAVYATNAPPTALGRDTPAAYGLAYEDVAVRARDGVVLSAWYVHSSNRAAVLVLHGSGCTRTDVLAQAVVLARHGYGVLLPDARGHGRALSPA